MKTPHNKLAAYNEAVRTTFFAILEKATNLLATIEQHELRCTLIREGETGIIYQLVNPLLFLSLEAYAGKYCIRYGFQHFDQPNEYSKLTALFTRCLYKYTAKETTTIDIEQCIATEWLIVHCDEMYSYIEEHNRHHVYKLIAYKPQAKPKKRQLQVA